MRYQFESRLSKGFLKIEGPLAELDSTELERLFEQSLEECQLLELNIDNITDLSLSCVKIIGQVPSMARQKQRNLTVTTRYNHESMGRWLRRASTV